MKSAGINFGLPNTEYILKINDAGEATSCYNQDTDTEYIGGGGGGDFSTAEVKIKANVSEIEEFCFINPDSARAPGVCAIPMPWELTQDGPLYKIILYKNLAVGVIAPSVSPNTLQVTGDIEYEFDEEEEVYIVTITGDGTISLSEQSN